MKKIKFMTASIFFVLLFFCGSIISCASDDSSDDNSNPTVNEDINKPSEDIPSDTPTDTPTDTPSDTYDDSALSAATMYVIGDSTVCNYVKDDGSHTDATYFYPRYGYGTQLGNYLSSKITVNNLALSGRSAKSFLAEANYQTFVNGIKAGDFLVIGFGHNDQKSDDADRFASAAESTDTEGSFKNILWNKYAKIAQDKGATVILCSPIVRINANNDYSGANGHHTATGDYGAAVKELAEEKGLDFVHLRDITAQVWAEATYDRAKLFHAVTSGVSQTEPNWQTIDGTHINIFGAKRIAYEFAKVINNSDSALAPYVNDTKLIEPTAEKDLVQNDKFVYVAYTVVDWATYEAASNLSTISTGWYGTAFGNTGGTPTSDSNGYYATETSSGVFKVGQTGTSSPKGKITSSEDGFAFAFKQVDVSRNFRLTAKAKVLTVVSDKNQAGFGLMLRDDCYTPNKVSVNTNYVAAGLYAASTADTTVNFARESTKLVQSSDSVSGYYAVDDTAEFTIERIGQVVTVTTVYKDKTYTQTYTDFDFVAKDNKYMYVGMFGTRGTTAEFTEVVYTDLGESQGA